MGKGTRIYQRTILQYQDIAPVPVKAISVSTGNNNVGKLRINLNDGECNMHISLFGNTGK